MNNYCYSSLPFPLKVRRKVMQENNAEIEMQCAEKKWFAIRCALSSKFKYPHSSQTKQEHEQGLNSLTSPMHFFRQMELICVCLSILM